MAVGRVWYGAKCSYEVWERFARQANPMRTSCLTIVENGIAPKWLYNVVCMFIFRYLGRFLELFELAKSAGLNHRGGVSRFLTNALNMCPSSNCGFEQRPDIRTI